MKILAALTRPEHLRFFASMLPSLGRREHEIEFLVPADAD
jgi:hypothetical protein